MKLETIQTLNKVTRFLSPIAWLGLVAVGLWSFWSLQGIGELRSDGTLRTTLDKSVPYFFLLLVPFGAYMARKEYVEAREAVPLADAAAERQRQRRQKQKEAKAALANRQPLSDEVKADALATLDHLKAHGVIAPAEVDTALFLQLCEAHDIEDGDIYSVSTILALYAETHGEFANAFFILDQVEVGDTDIKAIIEGFARLAGRSTDLSDITVSASNHRKGGADGTARFTLGGTAQTIEFEYYNKNASSRLMEALTATFNPTPPYALAYFDSVYLVTRLGGSERAELNAALNPEWETFERL